jgi:CheY-like chemotaxis protein
MNHTHVDLTPHRILVVDDERQIHASIRLRLGKEYDLVFCFNARDALEQVSRSRFDLCLADIHMPKMDGVTFIDAARKVDPELGYVVISAFDSDDNLRRVIPLQVYEFISKPLPQKNAFESRIPEWIEKTRQRRREVELAQHADTIACDLDSAELERDVELVASENARSALRQTANLLTTVHAHLLSASTLLAQRSRQESGSALFQRNVEEARRTAEAAMAVAEGFFDSGYGLRDSSPAMVNEGLRDAIGIATRTCRADESNKAIDFKSFDSRLSIRGLSGISFLLMVVPALGTALSLAADSTTVGICGEHINRLDAAWRDPRLRQYLWVNRRHALSGQPGVAIAITVSSAPLARPQMEAWIKGEYAPLDAFPARGLVAGVQRCQGLVGFSLPPQSTQFRIILALPV